MLKVGDRFLFKKNLKKNIYVIQEIKKTKDKKRIVIVSIKEKYLKGESKQSSDRYGVFHTENDIEKIL